MTVPVAVLAALLLCLLWLAVVALGAILAMRGLHGRLVDEHPRCRRCDFDLIGSSHRPPVCPECGASLLGVGTVRLGRRRADGRCVIGGLVVLGAAVCPIGLLAVPGMSRPTVVAAPATPVAAARRWPSRGRAIDAGGSFFADPEGMTLRGGVAPAPASTPPEDPSEAVGGEITSHLEVRPWAPRVVAPGDLDGSCWELLARDPPAAWRRLEPQAMLRRSPVGVGRLPQAQAGLARGRR